MLCIIRSEYACICRGSLIGHPVENIRIVLTDGAAHTVDSSELAFKMAAIYAFRQVFFSEAELNLFYSSVHFMIFGFCCFLVLYKSKTCYNGACDDGRVEIPDRVPGHRHR